MNQDESGSDDRLVSIINKLRYCEFPLEEDYYVRVNIISLQTWTCRGKAFSMLTSVSNFYRSFIPLNLNSLLK